MTHRAPRLAWVTRLPDWSIAVAGLGVTQVLSWGSTYYLLAALAAPIAADRDWALTWVVGGFSVGMLVAAFVSPRMGRTVDRRGGRLVLATGSIMLACGLAGLAVAEHLVVYLGAWVVIGVGMSLALYDAAFATLGRLYGVRAATAISTLTLLGGLASTVCWPFSVWLVETFGWREACWTYAALHLVLALPIHVRLIPRLPAATKAVDPAEGPTQPPPRPHVPHRRRRTTVLLLAAIFTLQALVLGAMSVHILSFLQAKGNGIEAAVAIAAMIGPSQVAARATQLFLGGLVHPIWTLVASISCTAAGFAMLAFGPVPAAMGIIVYGAGIGLESIARGVIPLTLFGAEGYARLIGRLALPVMVAEGLAPLAAAQGLGHYGPEPVLACLALIALINVGFVAAIFAAVRFGGPGERP